MKTVYILIAIFVISLTSCSTDTMDQEASLYENEVAAVNVNLTIAEQELFAMVNEYRVSLGLTELKHAPVVYAHAQKHNNYMIAEGKISHDNSSARFQEVAKATKASYVAENVAKNFDSAESVLSGWLASKSHRETIEGNYTSASLSISYDNEGVPYYTQIFYR